MADLYTQTQRLVKDAERKHREVDAEFTRALRELLDAHEGTDTRSTGRATAKRGPKTAPKSVARRNYTPRGAARAATLELLADGRVWHPRDVAKALGKTGSAASIGLRRLVEEGIVVEAERGAYVLGSANGQPKLPDGAPAMGAGRPEEEGGTADAPAVPSELTQEG